MKHIILLFVGVAFVCAAGACAHGARLTSSIPTASQAVPPKTLTVDCGGGKLQMKGTLARFETMSNYEYVARLALTFRENGLGDPISAIHIKGAVVTASVFDDANPPSNQRVLHRDRRSVTASFTADGETRTMQELRFVVPKNVEAKAEIIMLAFTDGRLTWELPINLKRLQRQ